MKKGERLEISITVLATEDCDDTDSMKAGHEALAQALRVLKAGLPCKRLVSGVGLGKGPKSYRRRIATRRNPSAIPESGRLQ